MADSGFATQVTPEQMRVLLTDQAPAPEAVAALPGSGQQASRDDHKHPRLTSATIQTLDASGLASITFTRSFTSLPAVTCLLYESSDAQPVVFKVKSWTVVNSIYTGCVIQGYRSSILPALSGILLIGPLISALANFNVFGGSASGAQFCCIALQPSA